MNINNYLKQNLRITFPKVAGLVKNKKKQTNKHESISSLK